MQQELYLKKFALLTNYITITNLVLDSQTAG